MGNTANLVEGLICAATILMIAASIINFARIHKECIVGDTWMAARSRPNDDWGRVGNGTKTRRKARKEWLWYV